MCIADTSVFSGHLHMHIPFLVLEQALSNGCYVLFQPVMVPLPAMGMGNSWFMVVLLWQLNWQNLPFFKQLWLMVGKTWWICFCSHSGFLCVFHLLYTFYISSCSDVAVTWQKQVCLHCTWEGCASRQPWGVHVVLLTEEPGSLI